MLIRMFVDIILDSNRHNFVEVTKSENFATLELFHHALFKDILAALGQVLVHYAHNPFKGVLFLLIVYGDNCRAAYVLKLIRVQVFQHF